MPEHAREITALTVYCASSRRIDESYHAITRRLGELMGERGLDLVYGGGKVGLMGTLSETCRAHGRHVTGIITERLRDLEQLDEANDRNIVVRTMRERKALLEDRGDAMVILPGGFGTLEEFFEILVGRHLGEHDNPICLLNTLDHHEGEGRYYDPLLTMIDHMVDNRFASADTRELFTVHETPEDLIESLCGPRAEKKA
jgi:hypothetical protein